MACKEVGPSNMKHWTTLATLRTSSNSCSCCRLLLGLFTYQAAEAQARFQLSTEDIETSVLIMNAVSSHFQSRPDVDEITSRSISAALSLRNNFNYTFEYTTAVCPSDSAFSSRPSWQALPTEFPARVSQIRQWLRSCENDHAACRLSERKSLPTRLIDLFPECRSRVDPSPAARLVLSDTIATTCRSYTALSYCWGADRHLKATTAKLDTFYQDIPTSELPKTFSDAFEVTRQLGIKYIWIDALCIVQDDPLDWNAEVAKMHDVYAGAHLTIQASEAESPSGGCFAEAQSSSTGAEVHQRALFKTPVMDDRGEICVHVVPHKPQIAALNRRGWTLQETVLSHRIVQVVNGELHWRCRQDLLWETGIQYFNAETLYGNIPALPVTRLPAQNRDSIWNLWVENYSARRFSFERDRLFAISGLAEESQKGTEDTPCLGLWRSTLHENLAWIRIEILSDRALNPPMPQLILSWSSFSCRQKVEFNPWRRCDSDGLPLHHFSAIEVLFCSVDWAGKPYSSTLLSSKLVIRGPTCEIYLSEAREIKDCNPPYFNVNDETVDFTKHPIPWRCAVQWDEEGYREPGRWLCLLVERQSFQRYRLGGETFLVLEAVSNSSSMNVYRRVGAGSLGRPNHLQKVEEQKSLFDLDHCQTITLM